MRPYRPDRSKEAPDLSTYRMCYLKEEDLRTWIETNDRHHLWLAVHEVADGVAKKTLKRHPLQDDLVQEATIYTMKYVQNYQPDKCAAFTWITHLVKYGLRHHLRTFRNKTRREEPLEEGHAYIMA